MIQTQLKKGDKVIIAFPPGAAPHEVTFLKFSKDGEKGQYKEVNGRLMWYKTKFIVGLDKPAPDALDIDTESLEAQKQLDEINRLKNSKKHTGRKVTKRERIVELIKAGQSNKEIVDEIHCDPGYPSFMRKELFETKQISEDIMKLTHYNKYPKHGN